MWQLVSCANEAQKYSLFVGKDYTIGRRDCDVIITNDQSISRQHAVLTVSHSEANVTHPHKLPVLTIKDVSRLGTSVNGEKLTTNMVHPLQSGDAIVFGTVNTTFRVLYTSMVCTTSCLDPSMKKSVKAAICKLGGHVISEWRKDCSLLIMSDLSVTVKVICALVSQKPIVTPNYLEDLTKAVTERTPSPNSDMYIPPLAESQIDPAEVSFRKEPRRTTLFKGKTFIFLSPKQFKKLSIVVSLAGGTPILMEEGSDDNRDDILISPGTCVMQCDAYENTETLSQNAREWSQHVMTFIRRHGKRAIPDSELGLAVLHCSMQKHCNPNEETGRVGRSVPSQSLSQQVEPLSHTEQVEVLAQNTETTPETLKERRRRENHDISKINETVLDTKAEESVTQVKDEPSSPDFPSHTSKKMEHTAEVKQQQQSTITSLFSRKRERSVEDEEQTSMTPQTKHARRSADPVHHTGNLKVKREVVTPAKAKPVTRIDGEGDRPINVKSETPTKPSPRRGLKQARENRSPQEVISPRRSPRHVSRSPSPPPDVNSDLTTVTHVSRSPSPVRQRSSRSRAGGSPGHGSNTRQGDRNREGVTTKSEVQSPEQERALARRIKAENICEPDKMTENQTEMCYIEGYLNTVTPAVQTDPNRDEGYEEDPSLPSRLVVTEFRTLLRKSSAKPQVTRSGDRCMWNGRMVKNFKKFKKNGDDGVAYLPRIIGGCDLQVHVNGPRKDLDEWFNQELEAESQQHETERQAHDLFELRTPISTKQTQLCTRSNLKIVRQQRTTGDYYASRSMQPQQKRRK